MLIGHATEARRYKHSRLRFISAVLQADGFRIAASDRGSQFHVTATASHSFPGDTRVRYLIVAPRPSTDLSLATPYCTNANWTLLEPMKEAPLFVRPKTRPDRTQSCTPRKPDNARSIVTGTVTCKQNSSEAAITAM